MYTVHNCKPLLVFIQTEFRLTNKPIQNVLPTRVHIHSEQYTNYGTRCSVCVNIIIILYTVAPA